MWIVAHYQKQHACSGKPQLVNTDRSASIVYSTVLVFVTITSQPLNCYKHPPGPKTLHLEKALQNQYEFVQILERVMTMVVRELLGEHAFLTAKQSWQLFANCLSKPGHQKKLQAIHFISLCNWDNILLRNLRGITTLIPHKMQPLSTVSSDFWWQYGANLLSNRFGHPLKINWKSLLKLVSFLIALDNWEEVTGNWSISWKLYMQSWFMRMAHSTNSVQRKSRQSICIRVFTRAPKLNLIVVSW